MRGSTTRMKGGVNGKFSGNVRCNKMCEILFSCMSLANSDSESIAYTRTYHSYKLSLTNSTWKIHESNKDIWNMSDRLRCGDFLILWNTYGEYWVIPRLLRLLNFLILFHQSLRTNCRIFGLEWLCIWAGRNSVGDNSILRTNLDDAAYAATYRRERRTGLFAVPPLSLPTSRLALSSELLNSLRMTDTTLSFGRKDIFTGFHTCEQIDK